MDKKEASSGLNAKTIAIFVAIGVLLAAGGFGTGRFIGAQRTSEAEGEGEAEVAAVTARLEQRATKLQGELRDARQEARSRQEMLESQLAQQRQRAALLEARRHLGQVLLSLDDRNFGIGQQRLSSAVSQIEQGVGDDERLRAYLEELREAEVVVAGNLQAQRGRLRELVDQLDRLLDEPAEERSSEGGDEKG